MAKPPFQFKPTARTARVAQSDFIQTVGSNEVLATYSDVFVIANEGGSGMCNIYFYQKVLEDRTTKLGNTEAGIRTPTAQCVSRIILSPEGTDILLKALAENRGFTISKPATKEEER